MTSDARPNILVLMTDQQRFDSMSALGDSYGAKTPHMDRLVRDGVTFSQCLCTAPICSPSRATLMTGLYPEETGMPGNFLSPCPPLSPAIPGLGKLMRGAGYQTAYHGKWHLGGHLQDYGFEVGEECSHDASTLQMAARFWRDRDWIANERPFFHVVSFMDPHDIYFFDPEETEPGFKRPWRNMDLPAENYPAAVAGRRVEWSEERWSAYHRFYRQRLEKVDADIGLLLEELRCSGFFTNTWIIFLSDHGDMGGEHDIPFKGPYMYDGVLRVPLVIVPPRQHFVGDRCHTVDVPRIAQGVRAGQCSLLDVAPTVLELAGVRKADGIRGKSLLPWVLKAEEADVHEYTFAYWHTPRVSAVRSREWKYVCFYETGEEQLFDLVEDPHEIKNLVTEKKAQERLDFLRKLLKEHQAETSNPG